MNKELTMEEVKQVREQESREELHTVIVEIMEAAQTDAKMFIRYAVKNLSDMKDVQRVLRIMFDSWIKYENAAPWTLYRYMVESFGMPLRSMLYHSILSDDMRFDVYFPEFIVRAFDAFRVELKKAGYDDFEIEVFVMEAMPNGKYGI